jgi:hypothetical protein
MITANMKLNFICRKINHLNCVNFCTIQHLPGPPHSQNQFLTFFLPFFEGKMAAAINPTEAEAEDHHKQHQSEEPEVLKHDMECSIYQNYTASEVFVQGLAGLVNHQDVESMIRAQKKM